MEEISLNNSFEMVGFWWLPGQREGQTPGILRHDPGKGISLEIWKETDDAEYEILLDDEVAEIIQGIAHFADKKSGTKDYKVTLLASFVTNKTMGLFGSSLTRKVFYSNHAFIGEWFDRISDIAFDKLTFELEHLEQWIQYLPYTSNMVFNDKNALEKVSVSISKENHPVKTYRINDLNYDCIFAIHPQSIPFPSAPSKRISFEFIPVLEIKPDVTASYQELKESAFKVVYLLTLLIGKPIRLNAITGLLLEKSEQVCIFSRPTYITNKPVSDHEVMIPFPEIEAQFDYLLNAWFKQQDVLGPITYLLMEAFYSEGPSHRRAFLDMMQAFEAYHREVIGIEKIKAPNKLGKMVMRAPTLRERFQEQFKQFNAKFKRYICKSENEFIDIIVDSRNYYTHFNRVQKEKAVDGVKLYWAALKLRLILHSLIFKQIGIDDDSILKALNRNKYYNTLPAQHIEPIR